MYITVKYIHTVLSTVYIICHPIKIKLNYDTKNFGISGFVYGRLEKLIIFARVYCTYCLRLLRKRTWKHYINCLSSYDGTTSRTPESYPCPSLVTWSIPTLLYFPSWLNTWTPLKLDFSSCDSEKIIIENDFFFKVYYCDILIGLKSLLCVHNITLVNNR